MLSVYQCRIGENDIVNLKEQSQNLTCPNLEILIAGNNDLSEATKKSFIECAIQNSPNTIVSFSGIELNDSLGISIHKIKENGLKCRNELFEIDLDSEMVNYYYFKGENSVLEAIGFGYLELLLRNREANLHVLKDLYEYILAIELKERKVIST